MKKPKSAVSWMRKELNVKGNSGHTGRGSYFCYIDIAEEELFERVENRLAKWQESGLIERVEDCGDYLSVKLNKVFEDNSYRTFSFSKVNGDSMKNGKSYYACLFSLS